MSQKPNPALAVKKLDAQEHEAIRRCYEGTAEPHQQRLAIQVIVKEFCQPQDLLYVPGSFDETAFINGRAFVASRIRAYALRPVGKTQEEEASNG
jgi:hypothetical protein